MPPITSLSQLDLTKTYTYADYLTWQLTEWVELIRGKVRPMSPAPRVVHQRISSRLMGIIYARLAQHRCEVFHAPFDVRLTTTSANGDAEVTTVVQPDICVVYDPGKLDEKGCVGAPDWIIEILSPGNLARDTKEKFDLYEEDVVGEYWIVSPGEKSVTVYVLRDGCYQVRGEFYTPGLIPVHTLPEFGVEWTEVFKGV
ncbi:Uma2 family endonuclease [Hymenobacter luteus]|uniref:Uma2 family endonuclease n=2 Tax=Hymenobacter TaxID=89966 RepID=A0A7W9WCW1_9BACT|nr:MULTISPECIES: Uma2 family endonuclease [Hymenobacter]MBB4602567.1 Uma2 family endonuclease [Hymenobacter latericoloratus]MBB6060458.1 Uma2 family endonuclease [Hymenobacter luteus]